MFLPPCPAPDKLQTTIARLAALCGPGNVGTPRAENSHRPEAMRLDPFAPPAAPPIPGNAVAKNVTRLVIRAIRPAQEIEVMCSREIPEFVRRESWRARDLDRRAMARWRMVAGFTVDMHADSSDEQSRSMRLRDYYELALEDGGVYRLFRDLHSRSGTSTGFTTNYSRRIPMNSELYRAARAQRVQLSRRLGPARGPGRARRGTRLPGRWRWAIATDCTARRAFTRARSAPGYAQSSARN